jgi:hypothetical protein
MHCDAHDVVALQLDFAGVQPAANSDAERLRALCDRRGAADRAGRPIKRREKAVPKVLYLATPEPRQMLAHGLVMLVEQRAPFAVTKLGGAPCRFRRYR